MTKHRKWTEQEIEYLQAHWATDTATAIGEALDRSRTTISAYVHSALNLPCKDNSSWKTFLSAEDSRVVDRCREFLRLFRLLRHRTKASTTAGLPLSTLQSLIKRDEVFRRKIEEIEHHLSVTKQCTVCREIKPVSHFYVRQGACKSCCRAKLYARRRTLKGRLGRMLTSARGQDASCDLTLEYMTELWEQQDGLCFYTGVPMKFTSGVRRDPYIVSIDRMVPSKGYRADNVVLCAWRANKLKHNMIPTQFINTCKRILEVQDNGNLS